MSCQEALKVRILAWLGESFKLERVFSFQFRIKGGLEGEVRNSLWIWILSRKKRL